MPGGVARRAPDDGQFGAGELVGGLVLVGGTAHFEGDMVHLGDRYGEDVHDVMVIVAGEERRHMLEPVGLMKTQNIHEEFYELLAFGAHQRDMAETVGGGHGHFRVELQPVPGNVRDFHECWDAGPGVREHAGLQPLRGQAGLEIFQRKPGGELKTRDAEAGCRTGLQCDIMVVEPQAEIMRAIAAGFHQRGAHDVRVIGELRLELRGVEFGIAEFEDGVHRKSFSLCIGSYQNGAGSKRSARHCSSSQAGAPVPKTKRSGRTSTAGASCRASHARKAGA